MSGLKRYYGQGHIHYITSSCYRRQPLPGPNRYKDLFLTILEQGRHKYTFVVFGFVVMPEHVHLLPGQPKRKDLSMVMQVLKQRVSRRIRRRVRKQRSGAQGELWGPPTTNLPHFWQGRSYDFNMFTQRKFKEKLRYIHRNPVKRGLVELPEQWRWSSYRSYAYGEESWKGGPPASKHVSSFTARNCSL
jgi:putative transposase